MRSRLVAAVGALCLTASLALAAPITQADARKIALAKVPGTVVHEKAKQKDGHEIYSFKIKPKGAKPDVVKKVEVDDAGKIVKIKDVKPGD